MKHFALFACTAVFWQPAFSQTLINGSRTITGTLNACTSNAGSDAYVCPLSFTAYTEGLHVQVKADVANVGAACLNINGLGCKTIKKVTGGITTDLTDNDIRIGQ